MFEKTGYVLLLTFLSWMKPVDVFGGAGIAFVIIQAKKTVFSREKYKRRVSDWHCREKCCACILDVKKSAFCIIRCCFSVINASDLDDFKGVKCLCVNAKF